MEKINLKKVGKFVPVIGVILFIYLIINIGIEKIANTFILIPIQYYILAFLPFFLRLLLYTLKWQYICKKQKMDFSLIYLMKIFLISMFYGNVTPAGIGWHIRIFYLRKKSKASIEKCLANSIIDSELGFVTGMFLALIGSLVLFESLPVLFPIILVYFILHVNILILFIKKGGGSKIFKIFIRPLIPKKYKEKVDQSVESLYEDIPRLRDLLPPFLIEVAIWTLAGTQVYIIAQAFSINVPYITLVFIHIIAVIATGILPIAVGGLGVREGAFVFILYSSFGVAPQIAFVISLSGYLVKMLIPSMIGLGLSFKRNS